MPNTSQEWLCLLISHKIVALRLRLTGTQVTLFLLFTYNLVIQMEEICRVLQGSQYFPSLGKYTSTEFLTHAGMKCKDVKQDLKCPSPFGIAFFPLLFCLLPLLQDCICAAISNYNSSHKVLLQNKTETTLSV